MDTIVHTQIYGIYVARKDVAEWVPLPWTVKKKGDATFLHKKHGQMKWRETQRESKGGKQISKLEENSEKVSH